MARALLWLGAILSVIALTRAYLEGTGSLYKKADWHYDQNEENWGDKYPICKAGKQQSPVDVTSCHSRSSSDRPKVSLNDAFISHEGDCFLNSVCLSNQLSRELLFLD